MTKRCIHCYISGKVQGVWFRASAQEQAEKRNIKGWIRNLKDGRVEVLACGVPKDLEIFVGWLKEGPPLASVEEFEQEEHACEIHQTFKII